MASSASGNVGSRYASGSAAKSKSRPDIVRWDKRMSNHCAFALLVYTMLQIFFVVHSIDASGMSIAPYFGLLILVALIIPFCRRYERRWEALQASGRANHELAPLFRYDQIMLWALAIGLPFFFVALFKAIALIL